MSVPGFAPTGVCRFRNIRFLRSPPRQNSWEPECAALSIFRWFFSVCKPPDICKRERVHPKKGGDEAVPFNQAVREIEQDRL
jgi:hypothetical protein